MSRTNRLVLHEVERGEILHFLVEFYDEGVGATFNAILNHLDDRAYTVNEDELAFHLHYLRDKGYITLEEFARKPGEKHRVRTARITAAGIDRLDQRINDGVRP